MQVEERDRSIGRLRAQLGDAQRQVKEAKAVVAGHGDWFRRMKVAEARVAALEQAGGAARSLQRGFQAGSGGRPQQAPVLASCGNEQAGAAAAEAAAARSSQGSDVAADGAACSTPQRSSRAASRAASPFDAGSEPASPAVAEQHAAAQPARELHASWQHGDARESLSHSHSSTRGASIPATPAEGSLQPGVPGQLAGAVSIDEPDLLHELQAFEAPSEEPSSAQASIATPLDGRGGRWGRGSDAGATAAPAVQREHALGDSIRDGGDSDNDDDL